MMPEEILEFIVELVKKYPNDQELGEVVRKYINELIQDEIA